MYEGDHQGHPALPEERVPEDLTEGALQAARPVFGEDKLTHLPPSGGTGEDRVLLGNVEVEYLPRGQPGAEAEGEDPAGGGAHHEVEHLDDGPAEILFKTRQEGGGEDPTNAATVDSQNLEPRIRLHGAIVPLIGQHDGNPGSAVRMFASRRVSRIIVT